MQTVNFEQVYAIADMYGNNDERIREAARAMGANGNPDLDSWFNACVFIARQVQAQIEREAGK
jgi:hypothetical protein